MRGFDYSPFYRATVGFDRVFDLLDNVAGQTANGYPPYNIEKAGDNAYRIVMAVAGFAEAELNLTQPDLIRNIHHEYLNAGADIIETNTFGGNSFRLNRHGLADKVHEINLIGARLGREAADAFNLKKAGSALVAGSVGPLGVRIEPLGKTAREEARDVFAEQIAALVEGGVDLLILETFGYLEELHQAILAAR